MVLGPGSDRSHAGRERDDRGRVSQPDGGLGAQAPQCQGGIGGVAGILLAGQPFVQVIRDAGGAAVPSPADRLVGVAEQAGGCDLPGAQAVVGGFAEGAGCSRAGSLLGAVGPYAVQQCVNLGHGSGREPLLDSDADQLVEAQGIAGRVDERVRGQ